ncbi:hypothetical protein HDU91_000889 [Kappamyces sp. JEL0680]|nr:hypothetical protein HDU91_000889 [Kappamyces sp. JEL0680]
MFSEGVRKELLTHFEVPIAHWSDAAPTIVVDPWSPVRNHINANIPRAVFHSTSWRDDYFAGVRQSLGYTEQDFCDALSAPLTMCMGQAYDLVLHTRCRKFVLERVTARQALFLLEILHAYHDHLDPKSLLPRFLGIYCVDRLDALDTSPQFRKGKYYFVLTENAFRSSEPMYRFEFQGRLDRHTILTTNGLLAQPLFYSHLKNLQWLHVVQRGLDVKRPSLVDHDYVSLLQQRLISPVLVHDAVKNKILKQLQLDLEFLQSLGCVNYRYRLNTDRRLFLGIGHTADTAQRESTPDARNNVFEGLDGKKYYWGLVGVLETASWSFRFNEVAERLLLKMRAALDQSASDGDPEETRPLLDRDASVPLVWHSTARYAEPSLHASRLLAFARRLFQ